jgi:hypothetical protein
MDLVAGEGLTGGGVGDVVVDIRVLEPGLTIDASNQVAVGFGGSGLADTAARADHAHDYLRFGFATGCNLPDKITSIDPLTGDVSCGQDTDTAYGPGPSGRIVYDPSTSTFDVNQFLQVDSVTVPLTGVGYAFTGTQTGVVTISAPDFQPSSSGYGYYFADGNNNRGSLTAVPASTHLYAPLHLPKGAFVTELRATYEIPWEPLDEVTCWLDVVDVWTGILSQPGGGTPDCFTCFRSQWSTFPGVYVDNQFNAYAAHCFIHSEFMPGESGLFAVQVFYEYNVLQGPLP